jgi:hypothetical protein
MPEHRLPAGEAEGEVGGHPGREVLGLVVDDAVDVAEADAQEAREHRLGHGRDGACVDMQCPGAFGPLHGIARRAIGEGRQDHEGRLAFEPVEHSGDGEKVHTDAKVFAVVFHDAQRQDHGQVARWRRGSGGGA